MKICVKLYLILSVGSNFEWVLIKLFWFCLPIKNGRGIPNKKKITQVD